MPRPQDILSADVELALHAFTDQSSSSVEFLFIDAKDVCGTSQPPHSTIHHLLSCWWWGSHCFVLGQACCGDTKDCLLKAYYATINPTTTHTTNPEPKLRTKPDWTILCNKGMVIGHAMLPSLISDLDPCFHHVFQLNWYIVSINMTSELYQWTIYH